MDRQTLRSLCRIFNYVDKIGYEPATRAIEELFRLNTLSDEDKMHAAIRAEQDRGEWGKIRYIQAIRATGVSKVQGLKEAKEWVEAHYYDLKPDGIHAKYVRK